MVYGPLALTISHFLSWHRERKRGRICELIHKVNSKSISSLLESTAEKNIAQKSIEQDSKVEKQKMEQNNKPQEGQKDVFSPVYGELHLTVRRHLC